MKQNIGFVEGKKSSLLKKVKSSICSMHIRESSIILIWEFLNAQKNSVTLEREGNKKQIEILHQIAKKRKT